MAYEPVIKICGLRTAEILETVIEAGADMVGFMHFPKSPRHVGLDALVDLISAARGRVETAVILVNPDNSVIAEVAMLDPEWIQLHGTESPQRIAAIRAEAGIPLIKAVGVAGPEDIAPLDDYAGAADRLLLDAKPPKGADRPGGLGIPFDWSLLEALDPEIEFMLSGGLTPETVGEAVTRVHPFGVDVSSGVESAPGEKDPELIRAFIEAARRAARDLETV